MGWFKKLPLLAACGIMFPFMDGCCLVIVVWLYNALFSPVPQTSTIGVVNSVPSMTGVMSLRLLCWTGSWEVNVAIPNVPNTVAVDNRFTSSNEGAEGISITTPGDKGFLITTPGVEGLSLFEDLCWKKISTLGALYSAPSKAR